MYRRELNRSLLQPHSSSDCVISDVDDELLYDDIHRATPIYVTVSGESPVSSSRFKNSCRNYLHCVIRSSIWSNFTVSDLISLIVSTVPYISFLLVYAANCRTLVLPTSEGGGYDGCSARPGQVTISAGTCSGPTHLFDIGTFEQSWLRFSPNRLIASLRSPIFDFLSTGPYLAHYVLPVVYPLAVIILVRRIDCAQQFYRLVGWTMWIHYVLWFLVPTGPPWYYDGQIAVDEMCRSTGVLRIAAAHADTAPNSSDLVVDAVIRRITEGPAFARVDAMTGSQFFRTMFSANPVPYAAFPSGHVAWPTCMLLTQPWRVTWPFIVYVTVVAWATMYSGHHYISDVIGAVIVVLVVNRLLAWFSATSSCSLDVTCKPCLPLFSRLRLSVFRFNFH